MENVLNIPEITNNTIENKDKEELFNELRR